MTFRLWLYFGPAWLALMIIAFLGFDQYADKVAGEIINTVVESESAAIQQGNLLNSITKLQSTVQTSESLKGIAVYDRQMDPQLRLPLIVLGEMSAGPVVARRLGVFEKMYVHPLARDKFLAFHFDPRFVLWSYLLFAVVFTAFTIVTIWLSRRLESIRLRERAEVFQTLAQQIAHDIKSPLTALRLQAEVMEKKGVPAGLLFAGVKRIEEIAGDLRLRADSLQAALTGGTEFALVPALEAVLAEKRAEHPEHEISLQAGGDWRVRGADGQFKRVISNLINNAAEASAPGSVIAVMVEAARRKCRVSIVDQGRGIPENALAMVFERGFSAGKCGGSGLGLFHAREVIHGMGGEIAIGSTSGVGTCVTIELSAAEGTI